jgi:hypothetical protein
VPPPPQATAFSRSWSARRAYSTCRTRSSVYGGTHGQPVGVDVVRESKSRGIRRDSNRRCAAEVAAARRHGCDEAAESDPARHGAAHSHPTVKESLTQLPLAADGAARRQAWKTVRLAAPASVRGGTGSHGRAGSQRPRT